MSAGQAGHRLGVIHFGGRSERVVPLTPLGSAAQRQAIRAAIADPPRMGWTDPLEALELAYETLFPRDQRDPARQPVVILLTDGKPELSPAPSPGERAAYLADLRALVDRFREHGCPIFTIALSNEATDADPEIQTVYRNLWQEIAARTPPAEYHEARTAEDLPHIYHAVVAGLTGVEAGAPVIETTVEGQAVETIPVEPGLSAMTIVVLRSDPALEVRLLRPGGALARPTDPDVRHAGEPGDTREEVWTVADPRPGRWTLELQGAGMVSVWQDTVPQVGNPSPVYGIEVTALPPYVPAGHPLEFGVAVREASAEGLGGEPVAGPGVQVVVELRRAGFAEATALARDDGRGCDAEADDGRYCATLLDPPPGACTLRLRALLDGAEVARHEVAFEAVPLPALAVVSPRPGLALAPAAPITLEVRVEASGRPIGGAMLAAQGTLTASVYQRGTGAGDVALKRAGRAFVGRGIAPDRPGPFTLTVRLHGRTAEGLPFEDVARVPLEVALLEAPETGATLQSNSRRGGPGWILPLAGLAGLVALGGVGGLLIRRWRGRATLDGSLRLLAGAQRPESAAAGLPPPDPAPGPACPAGGRPGSPGAGGTVLDLPPVPSVVIGGTGKGTLPLPGEPRRVALRASRTPEGDVETWIAPLAGGDAQAVALNGLPLGTARRLHDGDVLTVGVCRLRYESLRQAGAQRARHRPRRKINWSGGAR